MGVEVDCSKDELRVNTHRATFNDGVFDCVNFVEGYCVEDMVRCPVREVAKALAEAKKNVRFTVLTSLN